MHERTITFPLRSGPHKGMFINTPGVHEGKEITEDDAHELFLSGKLNKIGIFFPALKDAEAAAIKRSKLFNQDDSLNQARLKELIQKDVLSTIHFPYKGR